MSANREEFPCFFMNRCRRASASVAAIWAVAGIVRASDADSIEFVLCRRRRGTRWTLSATVSARSAPYAHECGWVLGWIPAPWSNDRYLRHPTNKAWPRRLIAMTGLSLISEACAGMRGQMYSTPESRDAESVPKQEGEAPPDGELMSSI
ncbi:hypothetical protein EDB89DRAFT_1638508 [Lactarius sanguifluus]|nr:hypothetical protein EDB89DRAFT_1638508 [Lactarius sanguifluus]